MRIEEFFERWYLQYELLILIISIDEQTFRRVFLWAVSSTTIVLLMFYSWIGVLLWNFYSGSSESGSGVLIFSSWAHAVFCNLLKVCLSLDMLHIICIQYFWYLFTKTYYVLNQYYWLLKIQWRHYRQMDTLVETLCNL